MNTKNESNVEQFIEKLAVLSIDPTMNSNVTTTYWNTETLKKSTKRKADREYTMADLIPMDDLAFHWLQARGLNDDTPAWYPDENVMSYLEVFMPKKKLRISVNGDQEMDSSSEHESNIERESAPPTASKTQKLQEDSEKRTHAMLDRNGQCDKKKSLKKKRQY